MIQYHRLKQYLIPKFLNSRWRENHLFGYNGYAVRKFQKLYREKMWNQKRRAKKYVFYFLKEYFCWISVTCIIKQKKIY